MRALPFLSLFAFLAGCTIADDTADISPNASPANRDTELAASVEADEAQAPETGATDPTLAGSGDVTGAEADAVETAAMTADVAAKASPTGAGAAPDIAAVNPAPEPAVSEEVAAVEAGDTEQEEAPEASAAPALAVVAEAQPAARSPFARLFSRPTDQPQSSGPQDVDRSAATPALESMPSSEAEQTAAAEDEAPATEAPVITASIAAPAVDRPRAQLSVTVGDDAPLPGVRQVNSLYQIGHRDSFDPENFEDAGVVQVASAAGLAGLTGGRLAVQHEKVDVSCLKPKLVQTLRQIERRFGKSVVVTSGYRNKSYNRLVGGARESKHMSCEAADIQVPGVSKWDIAEYVRSLPGRGGVGTYCHTESVHVDIGSKRDWNWRCRRRS